MLNAKYVFGLMLLILIIVTACSLDIIQTENNALSPDFQRGVNYAHIHRDNKGYGSETSLNTMSALQELGVGWLALTPFGYQSSVDSTEIVVGRDATLTAENLIDEINNAHSLGLSVMLKPHIWSGEFWDNSKWRGDIHTQNEESHEEWFDSYKKYILHYAKIAQKTETEIFVIGHEFSGLTDHHEQFWREIIKSVREVYSGKLTYSAHQEEYKKITFWDDLDYIGIVVYFPLTNKKNATISEIKNGWEPYMIEMKEISEKYNKPIIFTEIGYRSVEGTTIKPWEWEDDNKVDLEEQKEAYVAIFEILANQDFIKGIYIWKYFTDSENHHDSDAFTIKDKPAEGIVKKWYGE